MPPRGSATIAQRPAYGARCLAFALSMALSSAVSGPLYAAFGVESYAAMALVAIAGGICGRIASRAGAFVPH